MRLHLSWTKRSGKVAKMKTVMLVVALGLAALCPATAQTPKPLRIAVTSSGVQLKTWFIEDLKTAQPEAGLSIEFVDKTDARLDYLVFVHQMGGMANIVIAFDPKGEIATSVLRSGRISAKGVMEASAVELAKKLAALTR
jgi:hypothetical protein